MDLPKDVAPTAALKRLDRAWKLRESEGSVTIKARVGDPDASGKPYYVTITVEPCR